MIFASRRKCEPSAMVHLDELPERSRMQPRPGMPESFRDYLHQRWEAGCRHGRTLFAEIRKLGYIGCYSGLAKFVSPWREVNAENRRPIPAFPAASQLESATWTGSRQLSPQVAAALLSKARDELTSQQAQIVDTLKAAMPWLRCHAQAGFLFSRDPARGQGDHPSSLDGRGAQDRYLFTGALCPNFETGPKRSGSGCERTMEQRPGRGTI